MRHSLGSVVSVHRGDSERRRSHRASVNPIPTPSFFCAFSFKYIFPSLRLPRQTDALPLFLLDTSPLIGIEPADPIAVAEAADPVDLLDNEPHPLPTVCSAGATGKPEPAVAVRLGEASHEIEFVYLRVRVFVQIPNQAGAGQVGGGPGGTVGVFRVFFPPRDGEGDVGAVSRVDGRRRNVECNDGRVAAPVTHRVVIR